jgi:hypothetical protein
MAWESPTDAMVDEDAHTHALYGLVTNEDWGGVVAVGAPGETTRRYEGAHQMVLICRCTDPLPVVDEIEAEMFTPGYEGPEYVAFAAFELASMRAFGVGPKPERGIVMDNVTDGSPRAYAGPES